MENLESLAWRWVSEKSEKVDTTSENYCKTRDVFLARLDKMASDLLEIEGIGENKAYIVTAVVGEIGNNSFDHNLGNWRDVPGVFFGYEYTNSELSVALVDRGQGILATLKKVRPELANDKDALEVAFTEVISGRAPEVRGNGLKFVRENVKTENFHLDFFSGKAKAELNNNFELTEEAKEVNGCLAILRIGK
jgi:hypothetical protein